MTASRKLPVALIAAFLILIGIVAPSRIICELRDGEPPQIADLFRQVPTRASLQHFESGLGGNCRLVQAVRPWVQYARFALLEDAGDKALVGRDGWFFYRPAVQYLIEPYSPPEDLFAAIVSFRDDLARRGMKLLVMPAPNKASIYPEMLVGGASPPVNTKTKDVLARLRDAGVETVDLFEVYDKARKAGGGPDYYLAQDSHWSPEGMRLAADVVARRLLASGWVEKGTARYETRPVTVERYGDVLRMIRVPQVEKLYEPQRMDCTQVVDAATGQPYKDDPNSPVLVLGDSFLRIFERDEPGSGGFLAHLAHNLDFAVTSAVNDGGASTLVRQQLAGRPALLAGKKVVIWEFVERDIRFGTEGWQVIRMP
ncbi:MAG: hypothetical protein JW955_23095 [Sedimentisphaerales bacterium]|nr:hypothetical protein [Sedimentisphaerales bacterium]